MEKRKARQCRARRFQIDDGSVARAVRRYLAFGFGIAVDELIRKVIDRLIG